MFSTLHAVLHHYFPGLERNTERAVEDPAYLKLGIVRSPYDRFVSLYFDKCLCDPGEKLKLSRDVFLQPVQGQLLEVMGELRGQAVKIARTWEDLTNDLEELDLCRQNLRTLQTISFEEFTLIAQRIFRRADADPHFQPQYRSYYRGSRLLPHHVFRLENMDQDWNRICALLEVQMKLTRENKTLHRPYREYYNSVELAAAVYRLYESDFLLFSYSRGL
jgi:hypothetical protein